MSGREPQATQTVEREASPSHRLIQSLAHSLLICCLSAWMSQLAICLRSLMVNRGAQGSVRPKVLSAQAIHYQRDER